MEMKKEPCKQVPRVAYFCMEYALQSSMKTFAGGLGILAGDYMKAARDFSCSVIGIGILWKQGYGGQAVDKTGRMHDKYCNYEYNFLEDTGVKVSVKVKDNDVVCKVWKVDCFGNSPVYLLDTDIPENENGAVKLRWITSRLYGGVEEERLAQEIVLGIGGVRALRKLGIEIDVYHFNEGHAAFAGFELIREKLAGGMSFEAAWERTREQIVFTTHTPVKEGNEKHPISSIMYMGANLGLSEQQLELIGGSPFNMTVAGLRLCKAANAVSRLHAITANSMWKDIQGRPYIIPITNGIHKPTWVDKRLHKHIDDGETLWRLHQENKKRLLGFVHKRTGQKLLEENITIGFARRAVDYKRPDLFLRSIEDFEAMVKKWNVQIIFSGKAHPLDDGGKRMLENLIAFSKKYPQNVAFIKNYDMEIAQRLVQGCDIWLNTPRRPNEASGTSGMKAAMNGVLNLSVLDGWWPECCIDGVNGWQFGDGFESQDPAVADEWDRKKLMEVFDNHVAPTYYEDRQKWTEMMRSSISTTWEAFDIKRMINEYYDKMYSPAE